MKEIIRFLQKEKHKKFLELFMIIEEISRKEDIISFSYSDDLLVVKTGDKDYYRIKVNEEVQKWLS